MSCCSISCYSDISSLALGPVSLSPPSPCSSCCPFSSSFSAGGDAHPTQESWVEVWPLLAYTPPLTGNSLLQVDFSEPKSDCLWHPPIADGSATGVPDHRQSTSLPWICCWPPAALSSLLPCQVFTFQGNVFSFSIHSLHHC